MSWINLFFREHARPRWSTPGSIGRPFGACSSRRGGAGCLRSSRRSWSLCLSYGCFWWRRARKSHNLPLAAGWFSVVSLIPPGSSAVGSSDFGSVWCCLTVVRQSHSSAPPTSGPCSRTLCSDLSSPVCYRQLPSTILKLLLLVLLHCHSVGCRFQSD